MFLCFNRSNLDNEVAIMAKYTLIPLSEIPKRRVGASAWDKRLGIDDWAKFFADLPEHPEKGQMAAVFPVESRNEAVSLEGHVRTFFRRHPSPDFTPVCLYRKVGDKFQVFMAREPKGSGNSDDRGGAWRNREAP